MQVIQSKIYEIRGQRVMLDRDLAELYGIETKRLKEAVRRNIERFEGEDFMVRLTPEEINELSRDCLTSFRQFFFIKKNKAFLLKISLKAFSVSD